MDVKIGHGKNSRGEARIYAATPYLPILPRKMKDLGGMWDADRQHWSFDARDEGRVRQLCIALFGTDGSEAPYLVDVQIRQGGALRPLGSQELWCCGRKIAWRPSRDGEVRLGEKVILIAGGFPYSGGSARYPEVAPKEGTVLEVRDVPRPLAEQEVARHPQEIALLAPGEVARG